ncbi:MAG: bifunctional phosphoribosyl-AMP cyclohydrolase/phosphoribosyl-ATP diphosphatase HisIE [Chitinophagales bacterium]
MKMNLNFNKMNDLIPAIVQDVHTHKVLMLGYMNEAAFQKTLEEKRVTFYSRSKQRLWTKGETSGNYLELVSIKEDCDQDALLVKAIPKGPVCHTGNDTCFEEQNQADYFLAHLEQVIQDRKAQPNANSYTSSLFAKGINKVAQKVGEEAVELVIEAKDNDKNLFLGEAADLMYHYLVLLAAKNHTLSEVVEVLKKRHQ